MSSLELTPSQRGKTISAKQKRHTPKTVLLNPFSCKWPPVEPLICEKAIEDLKSSLSCLKRTPSSGRKTNKKIEKNEESTTDTDSKADLRNQVCFGINAVTRALEHDKLQAVVIDRGPDTNQKTWHLIQLCASRECPTLCIPGISAALGPVLGFTSLLALGFKKKTDTYDNSFDDVINFITQKALPIILPWMEKEVEKDAEDTPGTDLNTDVHHVKTESTEDLHEGRQKSTDNQTNDYSHLYILKADRRQYELVEKNKDTLINYDKLEMDEKEKDVTRKKKKRKGGATYLTTNLAKLQRNEKRIKKSKKTGS